MNEDERGEGAKIVPFPSKEDVGHVAKSPLPEEETKLQKEVELLKDKVWQAFKSRSPEDLFKAVCELSRAFLGREDKDLTSKKKAKIEKFKNFFARLETLERRKEHQGEFSWELEIEVCERRMFLRLEEKHGIDDQGKGYEVSVFGYAGDPEVFAGLKQFSDIPNPER